MQIGDLDAAGSSIAPVLALPPDRLISWVVTRLGELAGKVERRFPGSTDAASLREAIRRVAG